MTKETNQNATDNTDDETTKASITKLENTLKAVRAENKELSKIAAENKVLKQYIGDTDPAEIQEKIRLAHELQDKLDSIKTLQDERLETEKQKLIDKYAKEIEVRDENLKKTLAKYETEIQNQTIKDMFLNYGGLPSEFNLFLKGLADHIKFEPNAENEDHKDIVFINEKNERLKGDNVATDFFTSVTAGNFGQGLAACFRTQNQGTKNTPIFSGSGDIRKIIIKTDAELNRAIQNPEIADKILAGEYIDQR